MKLLLVDTSGPAAGVCILKEGHIAYECSVINKKTHSANILPMVDEAFQRSDCQLNDMDALAVVVGPGSFTGVRIGVSMVKGMAHAANKRIIPVDALEALAYSAADWDGVVCPIQDARAGQVYGAAFMGGRTRLMGDKALKLEEYVQEISALGNRFLFVGDGVAAHQKALEKLMPEGCCFAPEHLRMLRPSAAALLAEEKAPDSQDYLTLMPLYLRAPQAERERARREAAHE